MKPVNFIQVNLTFTIILSVFCPYVKGLMCYVTVDSQREPKIVQCEEMFVLPTVRQMNEILKKHSNTTSPARKKGKLACRKLGLEKSCAFVSADRKMSCKRKIMASTLDMALQDLTMHQPVSLELQDCFCDMDMCNDGHSLRKSTSRILSVMSAMITLLLGNTIS